MENKTAVGWLVNEISAVLGPIKTEPMQDLLLLDAINKAKAMEKEQIKECWDVAHQAGRFEGKGIAEENWQTFEQYYNETYNK